MQKIRLGKTELMVTKTSMGCLPVQRRSINDGVQLIRAAYEGGINYFDTANAYTDSEKKIGLALHDVRKHVIISTKSHAKDADTFWRHLENSLRMMQTDYVDLFQLHNAPQMPDFDDPKGVYAAMLEAKRQGAIRHLGITAHKITVAEQAVESGMFETLQFPFSYISSERDLDLARKCKDADMGLIAMKALAGGLLSNPKAVYLFMKGYDNVVPIYGIQHQEELDAWLAVTREDPTMDEETAACIEKDRKELAGTFCRSCGYCMPCPVGIEISQAARMNMLLRRSPWQQYYTQAWQDKMAKIEDCVECRSCSNKCPYELDTPNLLKYMLKDYREFYEAHKAEL